MIYPLVVARSKNLEVASGEDVSPHDMELESIRDSIQTLRLDRDLGNITAGQYREQLQSYRLAAANALRRQAEAGLGTKEADLEQEVLEARAALGADPPKPRLDKQARADSVKPSDDQPGP